MTRRPLHVFLRLTTGRHQLLLLCNLHGRHVISSLQHTRVLFGPSSSFWHALSSVCFLRPCHNTNECQWKTRRSSLTNINCLNGILSASDLKLSSIHLISRIVTLLYMPYVYNIVKHVSSLIIYRPVQPMESKRKNKTGSTEKGHIPLYMWVTVDHSMIVISSIKISCISFFIPTQDRRHSLQRLDDGRWAFFRKLKNCMYEPYERSAHSIAFNLEI